MAIGNAFDVIVLGVGSMGSAACYHLAKRGLSVLGLEQFVIPHTLGSHGGQSRIIRKAYFEHPDYVPLLELAYRNWKELEAITGEQVYYPTGLLYWGSADHPVMQGLRMSSDRYGVPVHEEAPSAYPQLSIPPALQLLSEPDAGFLTPEPALRGFVAAARQKGAQILENQQVLSWSDAQGCIRVKTAAQEYTAAKLVITAGPWAGRHLPALSRDLTVTRQVMAWVMPRDPSSFMLGNFPCWMAAEEEVPGVFYGFPMLPEGRFEGPPGFKLAHHAPGIPTLPDAVDRNVSEAETAPLIRVLERYFKGAYAYTLASKTCLYTNTPDEHFIIDLLQPNVAVAAGFSGHGFKFASAVGEIMADLAIAGRTAHPISFLSASRLMNGEGL
jgi:sarcosine oxidase